MKKKALDPKRALFVQEYLKDLNATQAAIRAGYSKKTANKNASRLMVNEGIQKAIAKAQAARAERVEITLDEWLRELKIVGFSDLSHYIEIDPDTGSIRARAFDEASMPKNASRALESITEVRTIHESANGEQSVVNSRITFKLHSKMDALDKIGKHLGFFEKDNAQKVPQIFGVEYPDADPAQPTGENPK